MPDIGYVIGLCMDLNKFKKNNKYLMLALDQRGSFKKIVKSEDINLLIEKKRQIIEALDGLYSGILVDPVMGLPAYKTNMNQSPLLLCTEKSGYEEIEGERKSEIGYQVEELVKMGAEAIKLVIYFNPTVESANFQFEIAQKISNDCQRYELPFFFEIVTYGQGDNLVRKSIEYFLKRQFRADVYKIEFPGNENECQRVTEILGNTEWIMLTAGIEFGVFCQRLKVACQNGCSGFLAGRSVWKDLIGNVDKKAVLEMRKRFETISKIASN